MRVLIYSRVFPPATGGMERFAGDLARWLAARGHDVAVATRTESDAPPPEGVRVLRRPAADALLRAMRRADVVHINGLSLRGIAAALTARRPVVVTHQGHQAVCPTGLAWVASGACTAGPRPGPCGVCPGRGAAGRASVPVHRVAASRVAACNVSVSGYLARRLGLPRSRVVYNPVDARAFTTGPTGEQADTIAFAGRLVAEKGLDILIDALALLPGVRLEVAGDGPMRLAWEQRARERGVAARIRWRGALPFERVAQLYRSAAVVCVPSLWQEPYGYAAAEALALGCAVVATPRGALPELLAHDRGYLASAATPEAFAAALERALEDPARRRAAAHRGAEFARRTLHIDVTGPAYEATYREVAG